MSCEIDFLNSGGGSIQKLLWSTDLHFDAADKEKYKLYCDLVAVHDPDLILIGGDISNGESSFNYLSNLALVLKKPIYFILGNHDYYYASIKEIRAKADQICIKVKGLHYLTDGGIVHLTKKTCLIGHDGWSDARAGDYNNSDVVLNDYFLIRDLNRLTHEERYEKLNHLGDAAALYLKTKLTEAFKKYDSAIILTHVPPFEESCLYEGRPADNNWLPHFVSKITGEALEDVMKIHPKNRLLVLCGHSHWGQDIHVLPNLRVVTGQSELGLPNIQGVVLVN